MSEIDPLKIFRIETDAWMKSLGYSLHHHGAEGRSLVYTVTNLDDKEHHPSILCVLPLDGQKFCELTGHAGKLAILLKSGKLQYKHPFIQDWIDALAHYAYICEGYPPILKPKK